MLLNLPKNVIADDGSSLLFAASGALTESNSAQQMTVFGSGDTTASPILPDLWYAPNVAPVDRYFAQIMDLPAAELASLTGVKIYEVMLQAPDAVLRGFFAFLKQHDLKLSVEALPLVANPGQPGYGIESFGGAGDLVTLMSRIKTFGGDLASVAWDEPWAYGHIHTGIYSLEGVAAAVATAQSQIQALFPAVKFGDIEPVLATSSAATDLSAWFAAYKAAVGQDLDFFQADVQFWSPQWETSLAEVLSVARSRGIATSVIVNGAGDAATDIQWTTQAVARAELLEADPLLRPDTLVIQSWQTTPSTLASTTTAGTLASVITDVAAGAVAALQIASAAAYSPNGLLSSVAWTGGFRAVNDGTTLRFTSPDGTTVLQNLWSQVSHFSFDPSTSAITLATTSAGVASAQTITVDSDGFHFAASTPPAASASPDPLFDVDWYVAQYPQVLASGLSPYQHYMTEGWKQGLDPNPFFSTFYYLATSPDVVASGMNPLLHFEQYGWKEGRNPSASFDSVAYYRANPNMPAGTNPLVDYLANLASSGLADISAVKLNFSDHMLSGSLTPAVILPALPAAAVAQTTPAPADPAPVPTSPTTPVPTIARATPTSSASPEATNDAAAASIPTGEVTRYFDSSTGTQFATSSASEQASIAAQRPDLVKEGPAFRTVTGSDAVAGTADVYRFFDRTNGSHLFTASGAEKDLLVAANANLVFEGAVFREFTMATAMTEPVYRYFDTRFGTHFYTNNQSEKATIDHTRADLVFEGISFYAPKF